MQNRNVHPTLPTSDPPAHFTSVSKLTIAYCSRSTAEKKAKVKGAWQRNASDSDQELPQYLWQLALETTKRQHRAELEIATSERAI